MRVIGEIRLLRDAVGINAFIWDGKEFRPKILRSSDNVWIRRGNIVESKAFPSFKLFIKGLEYRLFFPGFSQVWFLKFEPLRFEPADKGLKGTLWVFSNGIWKPKRNSNSYECFVVKGKVPFWSVLLTLLGVARVV
jgi:hypothetical protein